MKQLLQLALFVLISFKVNAQYIYNGPVTNFCSKMIFAKDTAFPEIAGDTSANPLWQVGNTTKPYFVSGSVPVRAMMTDTSGAYPVNANNWFVLKINQSAPNVIVDFWHKYQTDSAHDGGAVEFSLDKGATWGNVANCYSGFFGIIVENFYSKTDTLITGEPAFSGHSDTERYSRLQFFDCIGEMPTSGTSCSYQPGDTIYLRFRFISDNIADTLAGWKIDSIKLECPGCVPGAVARIDAHQQLNIFPNPSTSNTFNFPAIENEQDYLLEIYNTIGTKVKEIPYCHSLNLNEYPKGIYFFRATNGVDNYSGKLQLE